MQDQNGSTRRLRGILVSFKGDWKWKVQALHLTRHYNCSMVCHLCMATKGPPFAFEDLDIRSATWLQSIGAVLPWEGDPPATQIPGFTVETDRWDLLHVFHLGVGRLTAGSAIVVALINCFVLYGDCGWLHAKLCIDRAYFLTCYSKLMYTFKFTFRCVFELRFAFKCSFNFEFKFRFACKVKFKFALCSEPRS